MPEYVVDQAWRRDQHFDGGYIFRDKINFDMSEKEGKAILKYGLDSKTPNRATRKPGGMTDGAVTSFRIPIEKSSRPGIRATLIIAAQRWQ